jgi:phosphatidylglycerophosphate synthase
MLANTLPNIERNPQLANRRPIRARSLSFIQRLAVILVEAGLTPNQISSFSVVFAGLGGLALLCVPATHGLAQTLAFAAAALFIQMRLLCNLLDGLMAVEGGLRTTYGDIFNEFPDRISDSILFVCAGYAAQCASFGWQLGWSAALLACMTAYIRAFGDAKGLGQDYSGPMAKQQRMFFLTVACIVAPIETFLFNSNWSMLVALIIINTGALVTCVRRTQRLAHGLRNK